MKDGEIEKIEQRAKENGEKFILSTIHPPKRFSKIKIGNLREQDLREILSDAFVLEKLKMGEECISTIMKEGNGNPQIIREVLIILYDNLKPQEKIISKADYLSQLQNIMTIVARKKFSGLYQNTPPAQKEILVVIAKAGKISVSDIAKKIRKPLGQVTALVGRLVASGQIIKIERGVYSPYAGLYGRYVLQRMQP
ncbi:MarR family transcriptional regulator [Candidatus Micrarchaeota archaeon]|nr:MarR family transcriptional regulator [Candidatus Micrarchaeota archaeon]